jgi:hypothetical protein
MSDQKPPGNLPPDISNPEGSQETRDVTIAKPFTAEQLASFDMDSFDNHQTVIIKAFHEETDSGQSGSEALSTIPELIGMSQDLSSDPELKNFSQDLKDRGLNAKFSQADAMYYPFLRKELQNIRQTIKSPEQLLKTFLNVIYGSHYLNIHTDVYNKDGSLPELADQKVSGFDNFITNDEAEQKKENLVLMNEGSTPIARKLENLVQRQFQFLFSQQFEQLKTSDNEVAPKLAELRGLLYHWTGTINALIMSSQESAEAVALRKTRFPIFKLQTVEKLKTIMDRGDYTYEVPSSTGKVRVNKASYLDPVDAVSVEQLLEDLERFSNSKLIDLTKKPLLRAI